MRRGMVAKCNGTEQQQVRPSAEGEGRVKVLSACLKRALGRICPCPPPPLPPTGTFLHIFLSNRSLRCALKRGRTSAPSFSGRKGGFRVRGGHGPDRGRTCLKCAWCS